MMLPAYAKFCHVLIMFVSKLIKTTVILATVNRVECDTAESTFVLVQHFLTMLSVVRILLCVIVLLQILFLRISNTS